MSLLKKGYIIKMKFSEYEQKINLESFENLELTWDERAFNYYENNKKNPSLIPAKIVEDLRNVGLIKNNSILDIGGGAGFYAKEFIKNKAISVNVLDISNEMLKYAKDNVSDNRVSFEKKDWLYEDVINKYDLVFSAMCPIIRLQQSIDKMIKAANKYCAIVQNIKFESSINDFLKPSENKYDPHNDKDFIKVLFNYLIDLDYQPQLIYYPEFSEEKISKEKLLEKKQDMIDSIKLADYSNDILTIKNYSLTVLIYWQVNK